MICMYKFFTCDRLWRNQTGERAPFWFKALIFTCADGQCFVLPVAVHQRTHYTQYLHYNISSDWLIHHSSSGYIYCDVWHKSMSHFASVCLSSPINPQFILYDVHDIYFDVRALDILRRHNIQSFIIKAGDYMHDKPNNKGPNMKLNIFYGNERMNCMRHHGTLKFTLAQMNYVLVETWESFKISPATITHKYFNNTHLLPPLTTKHWHQPPILS